MRRLVLLLLFTPFAQVAHGAEVTTTPGQYEECLVSRGAVLWLSPGADPRFPVEKYVTAAFRYECTYEGSDWDKVTDDAFKRAAKEIPHRVRALYDAASPALVDHAKCVANALMSDDTGDVATSTDRAMKLCAKFGASHTYKPWEVTAVSYMFRQEMIEAQADEDRMIDDRFNGGRLIVPTDGSERVNAAYKIILNLSPQERIEAEWATYKIAVLCVASTVLNDRYKSLPLKTMTMDQIYNIGGSNCRLPVDNFVRYCAVLEQKGDVQKINKKTVDACYSDWSIAAAQLVTQPNSVWKFSPDEPVTEWFIKRGWRGWARE